VLAEGFDTVWARFIANVQHHALQQKTTAPPPVLGWLSSPVLQALGGLLLLLFTKGFSVYGLQLVAPLRTLMGLDDKQKEASGTIERYRREFGLLCKALDSRLVVFIDDLDRCNSATVNGVLEITNYLVDVGECFVVLGAAINRIEPCITAPADGKYSAEYARDYLRKLIHVQLPVPLAGADLKALLGEGASAAVTNADLPPKRWARIKPWLLPMALALLMLGMLAWGMSGRRSEGAAISRSQSSAFAVVTAAPSVPASTSASAASAPTQAPASASSSPLPAASAVDNYDAVGPPAAAGGSLQATQPVLPWAVALSLLACGWVTRWVRRNRERVKVVLGGAVRSTDSPEFMQALRLWNAAVVQHDPTPRHVKRFYNHARLFAAYEREEAKVTGHAAARESALVAMAALHHVSPKLFDALQEGVVSAETRAQASALESLLPDEDAIAQAKNVSVEAIQNALQNAINKLHHSQGADAARPLWDVFATWRAHCDQFGWQTTSTQMERFKHRVQGTRDKTT
jgi:hypothetical protein